MPREAHDKMQDNGEVHVKEPGQDAGEGMFSPRSKYERIMLAAAEAARLNEEVRRKGIKLDQKVTLEALKRVDEGKVKGIFYESDFLSEEPKAPAADVPRDQLFGGESTGEEPIKPSPPSDESED